ncbi:hypothetical protein [Paracoccus sp. DMF]|uniref:hypothetical protein n=1 Tax=Paracoccus sp. DMF TaxID=400837 RepID=UPI001102A92A|nr:hypothetical protein [Paracoccus sp. DMF]MCV2448885.1 hypothetical protein [Paracoccus sp. DMF]
MIRELLTPEAQRDPYAWASVLLAHAWIGGAAYPLVGWWLVAIYAAFEAVQAVISRRPLWWDSALDWCAVCLGAASVAYASPWPAAAVLGIALVGWRARS